MRAELRRLAKGSMVYGVGTVIQRFMSLLLLPFFTRVLSPEEYGAVALISLVSVAVIGFLNLGTGNSMSIMYFERNSEDNRHELIWSTAFLLLLNCTFIGTILFFSAPQISYLLFETFDHKNLIRITLCATFITVIIEPFYAELRFKEQAIKFVTITSATALFGATLSVILVLGLQWGVVGLLLAALFGQLFAAVVVAIFVARHLKLRVDLKLFWPLARIGFPSIFGIMAFLVIDYSDRQMLQRFVDLNAVGIYSIGYNLALVMLVAVSAFGTAWPPFFFSFAQRKTEAIELFGKILIYYLIAFGFLTVLFFALAKPLTTILAPEFRASYYIIGIVAAAYMLKGVYLILLPGVAFAKKFYWQSAVEWTAALLNIALNVALIPLWGIVGAALATLASYMMLTALAWAISRRYLAVKYKWPRLFIATIAIAASCSWVFWASDAFSLSGLLLHSLFAVFMLAIIFVFFVLDDFERQTVATSVARTWKALR